MVDVFAALRATKFEDVYAPAIMQFGGSGSYGNGGEEDGKRKLQVILTHGEQRFSCCVSSYS